MAPPEARRPKRAATLPFHCKENAMRLHALCAAVACSALPASVLADMHLGATLSPYHEVPSVSSVASGALRLAVARDQQSIDYTLTFSGLQGTVTQSHIHFAEAAVNGPIVIWLCQSATNPAPAAVPPPPTCPQSGTVVGTITAASVLASPATQQLPAGALDQILRAMFAGSAYANIHSSLSPGGEMRGQIGVGQGSDAQGND
jgi:hypothetical protein